MFLADSGTYLEQTSARKHISLNPLFCDYGSALVILKNPYNIYMNMNDSDLATVLKDFKVVSFTRKCTKENTVTYPSNSTSNLKVPDKLNDLLDTMFTITITISQTQRLPDDVTWLVRRLSHFTSELFPSILNAAYNCWL